MAQTIDEKIAALEEAIQAAAVGGTQRTIRGRSVTYNLDAMRKELAVLVAQKNRSLPRSVYLRRTR